MIVRISGEGQFRLPDEDAGRLNELDNRAVSAVEQGDETSGHGGTSLQGSGRCGGRSARSDPGGRGLSQSTAG